ncbi:MAG: hypothetical protein QW228_07785 [Candidatus Aenigmatarchaeota archaeon]
MAVIVGVLTGLSVRTKTGWYELVPDRDSIIEDIKQMQGKRIIVYGEVFVERISSLNIELKFIEARKIKPVF